MIVDGPDQVAPLRERIRILELKLEERDRAIKDGDRQIALLMDRVEQLTARIVELEEKLAQNSSNSSQPPSADPPQAKETRRRRKKGKRKRGGQRGHKGHHREMVPCDQVDEFVERFPETCRDCGCRLARTPDRAPERHQVIEAPPIEPHVIEYRMHQVRCPCCRTMNREGLPEGVSWSPFGPRLVAIVGLLTGAYRLSKRNAANLLEDLLGIRLSVGALSRNEQRLSSALAGPVNEAHEYVQSRPVKYTDATGWRQGRARMQLWTLACALVTVFKITADGTKETVERLVGEVKGVLVSDRAAVFLFWQMKQRQVCWAHLIRTFVAFSQRDRSSRAIGDGLLDQAHRVFKWWHRVRDGNLSRASFQRYIRAAKREVKRLLEGGSACDHAKTRGTCKNMLKHFEAMWTFARVEGVEPTNNHSERELRPAVIWRKTSFATQSDRGTRFVERIMTVVATLRKQRRHVLEYLTAAYGAALKHQTPPSLLPAEPDAT